MGGLARRQRVLAGAFTIGAAGSPLHSGGYARAVPTGAAQIDPAHVTFDYWSLGGLATVAITLVLGLALARTYMRIEEPAPMTLLRRLQTGSVNDYAAFAVT